MLKAYCLKNSSAAIGSFAWAKSGKFASQQYLNLLFYNVRARDLNSTTQDTQRWRCIVVCKHNSMGFLQNKEILCFFSKIVARIMTNDDSTLTRRQISDKSCAGRGLI